MKEHLFRCLVRIKIPKEVCFYLCSVHIMSRERKRWAYAEEKTRETDPSVDLNQFCPGCLSVKLMVHLSFFFPHLKIYMRSPWIPQLIKLRFGGNILKEKMGKCSTSPVSKSQLEVLRKKLMVLNELHVMVLSRKHYEAECYQTCMLIPELS